MSVATARRRRRLPAAIVLVLALAVLGALWSVLAPSGRADTGSGSAAVAQGKELFASGCSSCHGLGGQGTSRAPALVGVGSAAVYFQVSTGRMPLQQIAVEAQSHQSRYDNAEIAQLGAYVQSLGGGPQAPNLTKDQVASSDLAQGGELFRANCASCHNFAGAGNALDEGRYAPNITHDTAEQIYTAMQSGPESMPVFNKLLTDNQKVAIANYVLDIRRGQDPGGSNLGNLGPVPEGVVIFVLGIGGLIGAILWIGGRN